jgi:hypothetical protein
MAHFSGLVVAFCILSAWLHGAAAQTEQRVALVIGNSAYQSVNTLKNPTNDAKAMAVVLRRAGFEVIERENATRRAMIESTRAFGEKLSPGGIGLVFYAGHGVQVHGVNYLLPVDATLLSEDDLKYEAIDVQDLLNKLDDSRVRLSLLILDACRDNPFVRSFRSASRGLAQIDAPRGTIIAYATAPGKTAADGNGENGVYTAALIKALSEPGRKLQDVFATVVDEVERRTANAQTPWISSSFRGDFYFFGPVTVNTTSSPSPTSQANPSGISTEAQEQAAWVAVAASTTAAPFEAFLKRFPNGFFSEIARAKLAEFAAKKPQALVMAPGPPPEAMTNVPPKLAFGPPMSGEALSDAISALLPPEARARQRANVDSYVKSGAVHRSMAASRSGVSWWSVDFATADQAEDGALEACAISNGVPCGTVAIDDKAARGSLAVRVMPRVTYSGTFDPRRIPTVQESRRAEPEVQQYLAAASFKSMALHPWGRVFTAIGMSSQKAANDKALKECGQDPGRKGASGPCHLYAEGNNVVLSRGVTGSQVPILQPLGPNELLAPLIDALPQAVRTTAAGGVRAFLTKPLNRAIAINPGTGQVYYWFGRTLFSGIESGAREACEVYYDAPCRIAAVNNTLLPATDVAPANAPRVAYSGAFDPLKIPAIEVWVRDSPSVVEYLSASGAKAMAIHLTGRVFTAIGKASRAEADEAALDACVAGQPDWGGGPCYLYASGDRVVLAERRIRAGR